jgi:hypothetical protein
MVLVVKKAIFQRMGSSGKGRSENRWDASGAGQPAPPEVYFMFPLLIHQEESAADRQSDDRSVPGDTAECCSVSEISNWCYFTPSRTYTSNPSHSPLTVTVCWDLRPYLPNYTASH